MIKIRAYILFISLGLLTFCACQPALSPTNPVSPRGITPTKIEHHTSGGGETGTIITIDLSDEATRFIRHCEYCESGLEEQIRDSDFCILGKTVDIKKQVLLESNLSDKQGNVIGKFTDSLAIQGKIRIDSIIYGNPDIKEIPFATEWHYADREFVPREPDPWRNLDPNEGETFLVLSKVAGKNITFIRVVRYHDTVTSTEVELYKVIKNLESIDKKDFQNERTKLLAETNDWTVLMYLFRRTVREGQLDDVLALIKTLLDQKNITESRKYIAYQLSIHILLCHYEDKQMSPEWRASLKESSLGHLRTIEVVKDMTQEQQQMLKKVIEENTLQIKTITEGFSYLGCWYRISRIEQDLNYKNRIKQIFNNLSKQFEKEKDYPEWEKSVKNIFPDDAPDNKKKE